MSDAMTYGQVMRRWEARGKELRTLKEELAELRRENEALRIELLALGFDNIAKSILDALLKGDDDE